jgi:N-acyl-D-amino-acid deacylase
MVAGNCGVGFAPAAPDRREWLIELMEGVEDIPGAALSEGIRWSWETFPQYLDALATRRFMMDVGTQVPHAAVRAYVMGERAGEAEPTDAELAQMAAIVREGIRAGALGVSTSRILAHRTSRGAEVPGTFASERELEVLARVLGELGTGVFEVVPRGMDGEVSETAHAEIDWMGRLAKSIGRPLTFSLVQTHTEIDRFERLLDRAQQLRETGAPIFPQVANRATGILIGLQSDEHTFSTRETYRAPRAAPPSRSASCVCAIRRSRRRSWPSRSAPTDIRNRRWCTRASRTSSSSASASRWSRRPTTRSPPARDASAASRRSWSTTSSSRTRAAPS